MAECVCNMCQRSILYPICFAYSHIHVQFYLKEIKAILCLSVIVVYDSIPRAAVDQRLERSPLALGVVGSNTARPMWALWWTNTVCVGFLGALPFLPLSSFHQFSHHHPISLSQSSLKALNKKNQINSIQVIAEVCYPLDGTDLSHSFQLGPKIKLIKMYCNLLNLTFW